MSKPGCFFSNVLHPRGFTLIELLVVVAIISILSSIAVPNFVEAQSRAKTSRVKADMHALTVAIESYHVDDNAYPFRRNTNAPPTAFNPQPELATQLHEMSVLTTPVGYITSFPIDIFNSNVPPPNNIIDYYDPTQAAWLMNYLKYVRMLNLIDPGQAGWMLVSVGPDGFLGASNFSDGWPNNFQMQFSNLIPYDPTNGTVSLGNIYAGEMAGSDQFGSFFLRNVQP